MKVLLLGGNRFFGRKLAERLIKGGHHLTLLNRGNTDDGLGESVDRIICDRQDIEELEKLVRNQSWDLIYDQICFDYETAKQACQVFKDKTKRYIFTSSQSVYHPGQNLTEDAFDPKTYKIEKLETADSNYAEAKRQAERGFHEFASFKLSSIRLPIVVGHDDYTKRFLFHTERIKSEKPIYFPNREAQMSFITSDFAGEALFKLATIDHSGPLNVASPRPLKLSRFVEILETHLGKNCVYAETPSEENHSPYGISEDWFMNCDQLKSLGLVAEEVEDWLPKLLK